MSWYRTGTVGVTNASAAVTGAGTAWLGVVRPGWGFVGPDGRVYEVLDVSADGALTLARNYAGSTVSGAAYDAFPTQGEIAALADGVATLIADYAAVRDAAGAGRFAAGSASLPGLSATDDTNTGALWPAADTFGVATGGVERLRVTSAGNVGIGTAGPSYPLDVNGAMRATAFRNSLGNVVFSPGNAAQPTKIGAGDAASYTSFHKSGTMTTGDEAMRIDSSGRVGIGTTAPATPLDVNHATDSRVRLMLAGVGVMQMQSVPGANRLASSNTDPLELWTNGVRRVVLDSAGNHIPLAQASPPALTVNNQMVMNLTSNTNLRISVRGSDGVTRVANITLA